ncbi:PD-(D/E)XK nuclease family protein [Paenibacillus soyae]|uniref:PD-(D/E)XK nuclease family protein n=1 Tax=Paenibacillus soyae TaxID=2969249 RepID=A0A9X2MQ80_9BACL|nr:PD-(D/E)XK nuclease family protein [Paenibacillus soyae]MCR2804851.1 PD-(D/E)XK nuclease family protein [Paenibacillus soyae]
MGGSIEQLYRMLREEPLRRKMLLTVSYAQGHLWMEHMCRRFGDVPNAYATTLEAWVLERLKLQLARAGKRYLTSSESRWVVYKLMVDLQQKEREGFLAKLTLTPGLADAFHRALLELRACGLTAELLEPERFEQPAKGELVRKLLASYEQWLTEHRRIDWGGLAFRLEDLRPSADEAMLLVDPEVLRTSADRALLERVSGGCFRLLEPEGSFLDSESFPYARLKLFRAAGALAEGREMIRRIVSDGISFDQVEIIASGAAQASALMTIGASQGIPMTFEEGRSLRATRVGKAALCILDWLQSDYAIAPIASGLRQDVIRFDGAPDTPRVSSSVYVRELQGAGVGWGSSRYALLVRLAEEAAAEGRSEEKVQALRTLHRTFEGWLGLFDGNALHSPQSILEALIRILGRHAVIADERDAEALARMRSLLGTINAAGSLPLGGELSLRCVREALEGMRAGSVPIPKPGMIHVSSLAAGGMTGRPHTFIAGMDERSWSSASRQDSVLQDEERLRIHPELPLGKTAAERLADARNRRLGMIRGTVTASFSSYDMAEQKERMPAYELLQLFRRKTGAAAADYEQLMEAMGSMRTYTQAGPGTELDRSELWMRALRGGEQALLRGGMALLGAYPHLAKGAEAMSARSGELASPFDGIVETKLHRMKLGGDAGPAVSASMLERYGRCPLRFFFQYQLGVEPEEEAVFDRTRWLDASRRGSLLHGIFHRYLNGIIAGDTGKAGTSSLEVLFKIAEDEVRRYAEEVPAPSEPVFRKERAGILGDVRIFFDNERTRSTRPVLTELRLHGSSPLNVVLGDGWTLPIKGFVDRVDEVAPHRYKIYDYKTGSPGRYGGGACFSGGALLQLPLYGLAVEQWMKETGYDPDAEVVESSYLFPTEKGMGEEVSRPQNRRAELAELLHAATSAIREGVFPPTSDAKQCDRCEYSPACGQQAKSFAVKRESERNAERLRWLMEVSRHD